MTGGQYCHCSICIFGGNNSDHTDTHIECLFHIGNFNVSFLLDDTENCAWCPGGAVQISSESFWNNSCQVPC
jgi:hypothetical protein